MSKYSGTNDSDNYNDSDTYLSLRGTESCDSTVEMRALTEQELDVISGGGDRFVAAIAVSGKTDTTDPALSTKIQLWVVTST